MIRSFNKLVKLLKNNKLTYFYITIVNQFNYQVNQLQVNTEKKTFKTGSFSYNSNITTKSNFYNFIEYIKALGYKEA